MHVSARKSMLKSLRLKNFFGFADETFHFHPNVNILVGINGSGKSSFLRALQLLKTLTFEDLLPRLFIDEWGGFDAVCMLGIAHRTAKLLLSVSSMHLMPTAMTPRFY